MFRVRIRGIYATALTALLSGQGFGITDPSEIIRGRFTLPFAFEPEDVNIAERRDRQGVLISGFSEAVEAVRAALQQALPHALFSREARREEATAEAGFAQALTALSLSYNAEFPATVKTALDQVRSGVNLTLPGHHWLKVIDADAVDQAELDIAERPLMGMALGHDLAYELVYARLQPGTPYEIDHVKVGERTIQTRGVIGSFRRGTLHLTRQFKAGGAYDSLNEPIMPGDFGIIAFTQGDWVVRRQYFRAGGELIGELHNINTPVELYPDHARYVDLEVDVAFWPPDRISLVDEPLLQDKVRRGLIPAVLAQEAMRWAERVAEEMRQHPPKLTRP